MENGNVRRLQKLGILKWGNFPSGPVGNTLLSLQAVQVQSGRETKILCGRSEIIKN